MHKQHEILFEPIQIGPKVLRNRFYNVPHGSSFGTQSPEGLAGYRSLRAEGGWAAVNVEWAPVCASTDEWPSSSAQLMDDEDARRLSVTVDAIHAHGALAGIELHHGGALSLRRDSRAPSLSASGMAAEVPPPAHPPETPKKIEASDIAEIKGAFVAAAIRARDIGFDIIYVYAGCGFLFSQFLSEFHNQRTDEYGGTLANRARLWLETMTEVRDAVGKDCAVATRIAADADGPWGHDLAETVELVRMADHLVDLWDVNMGTHVNMDVDITPSRFEAEGSNLSFIAQVRSATTKPVVGVSRLSNPDAMAQAIRSGAIDIIGSARQSIADPFLPSKVEQGRLDEVRECLGINQCLSGLFRGRLTCAQNATAGEEFRRAWHPENFARLADRDINVLVVGAGPAGMEAAIVLARRGAANVHLVDAAGEMGGHMRWVPRLPGLGEWRRFVDHRQIQIDKLPNLTFVPGVRLDVSGVRHYGADTVIIATGSTWATDGISPATHRPLEGIDQRLMESFTPEQIVVQGLRPDTGARVVIYDAEGYFMGAGIAELLRLEGYPVTIVTPHDQVAAECDVTFEGARLRQRLHDHGIDFLRRVTVSGVQPGRLVGVGEFGDPVTVDAEAVVLVTQRIATDELWLRLVDGREALAADGIDHIGRAGDCVSPRVLADVVFDGHRMARDFDGGQAATAPRRERAMLAGRYRLPSPSVRSAGA